MFITRFVSCLFAVTMTLGLAASASAQRFQPFIDPGYFNPDLQFFAPADVLEYGGEPQSKTGWFFDYNRLYVWLTRPQQEASNRQMDDTWGNRYDVGYMTKENHGWLFCGWHVDGPQANDARYVERITPLAPDAAAAGGGGGQQQQQILAVFPTSARFESETRERVFNLTNSLNVADLSSFEINKTFRLAPLHNGGYLEPFFGVRYVKFVDFTERDAYFRYSATGVIIPDVPPPLQTTAEVEQFTQDKYQTINNMFGGQLGLRSFVQRSRWTLSNEVRVFAMQNFQDFSRQIDNTFAGDTSDPDGGGTADSTFTQTRTLTFSHGSEFVWGGEVRADAAFQVTRDIGVKFGFNFMEFAGGIGRGQNFLRNSEDVTMVGVNFGLTINR